MKKILISFFVIIIILCTFIPLFSNNDIKDYCTIVTTMLSGLCGGATLYIAILLYDRYGVESKTKESNLTAIKNVILEIQKISFVLDSKLEYQDNQPLRDCIININFQSTKDFIIDNLTPAASSEYLYYRYSGMLGCKMLVDDTLKNVDIPKEIVDALKKLSVFFYEPQKIQTDKRPFTILFAYSDRLNDSDKGIYLPKQKYSVVQFLDAYFGVKDAIEKWYKDNGINIDELNFTYC